MKAVFHRVIVAAVLVIGVTPAAGLEPFALYDAFSGANLRARKWFGREIGDAGRDVAREIVAGELRMRSRAYGRKTADGFDTHLVTLDFRGGIRARITAIQATIRPTQIAVRGCEGSPAGAVAIAEIGGAFFNTGPAVPGNETNDVLAFALLERSSSSSEPEGTLDVSGIVLRCDDESCSSSTLLDVADLGIIAAGATTTVAVQWDAVNDVFVFDRDGTPTAIPYSLADEAPAAVPLKRIQLFQQMPNCSTGPRALSSIEAFFDDIRVNESALAP